MNKVVFTAAPGVKGWKSLLLHFGISPKFDESMIFNYCSYEVTYENKETMLQLFFVPSLDKDERLLPLYFRNVKCFVVVFDQAKMESVTYVKKVYEDIISKVTCPFSFIALGYEVNDAELSPEIIDFLCDNNLLYFNYSFESAHKALRIFCEFLVRKIKEISNIV